MESKPSKKYKLQQLADLEQLVQQIRIELYGDNFLEDASIGGQPYICNCGFENIESAIRCADCKKFRPNAGAKNDNCGATNPFNNSGVIKAIWKDDDYLYSNQGDLPHCVDHCVIKILHEHIYNETGIYLTSEDIYIGLQLAKTKPKDKASNPLDFDQYVFIVTDQKTKTQYKIKSGIVKTKRLGDSHFITMKLKEMPGQLGFMFKDFAEALHAVLTGRKTAKGRSYYNHWSDDYKMIVIPDDYFPGVFSEMFNVFLLSMVRIDNDGTEIEVLYKDQSEQTPVERNDDMMKTVPTPEDNRDGAHMGKGAKQFADTFENWDQMKGAMAVWNDTKVHLTSAYLMQTLNIKDINTLIPQEVQYKEEVQGVVQHYSQGLFTAKGSYYGLLDQNGKMIWPLDQNGRKILPQIDMNTGMRILPELTFKRIVGRFVSEHNEVYEGQWKDNALHGYGRRIMVNGYSIGYWKEGHKHGVNKTFTQAKGETYLVSREEESGTFDMGVRVKYLDGKDV